MRSLLCLCLFALASPLRAGEKEKLFHATPLTEDKVFTEGIEGPNCDKDGNIFVVEWVEVGRVTKLVKV